MHMAFGLAGDDAVCTHRPDADQRAASGSGCIRQRLAFVIQPTRNHLGTKAAKTIAASSMIVSVQMLGCGARSIGRLLGIEAGPIFAFLQNLGVKFTNAESLHHKVNFCLQVCKTPCGVQRANRF